MDIEEYTQILKKEFSFLFEKCGFSVVYSEKKLENYFVFRIGIQSNTCRILFVREQGAGVIFLGTPNAPFANEMNEQWITLIGLLGYKLNKGFDWSFLDTIPPSQRPRALLAFSAKQFEPHCSQLVEMLSSEEKMKEWLPNYWRHRRRKKAHRDTR